MFSIAAFSFLFLSHFFARRSRTGRKVSLRIEKGVVFLTTIFAIGALVELASFVESRFFPLQDEAMFGGMSHLLVYGLGWAVIVPFILFALPAPIEREELKKGPLEVE